jgi:phosphopantothenoylcysteine decarboxylase / phosphopantothenate---cysteine ligase
VSEDQPEPSGVAGRAPDRDPSGPRVLLGVSGGIAAYKAVELLRLLREGGARVRVIPTAAALSFIGTATFEALSGEPVDTGVFTAVDQVQHVSLARSADLVIVAPATADLLARAAAGRADDLLTATLLTVRCPVLMAPAMHTEMWTHPATVANVATLRARGVRVLDPAVGRLTGADSGPGRLPEAAALYAAASAYLAAPAPLAADLVGRRVLVTAGGTREPLDPVRFLANHSSGKQGFAIAAAAAARGAEVTLVAANPSVEPPAGLVEVDQVGTTAELAERVSALAPAMDVVVMAAAPADFRPSSLSASKIKKTPGAQAGDPGPTLELTVNPDIIASLVQRRHPGQQIVAFAAETGDADGDATAHGLAKHRRKGADITVVNVVGSGRGFGTDSNEVVILAGDDEALPVPPAAKVVIAHALLDVVAYRLAAAASGRDTTGPGGARDPTGADPD